jgi:hypothetical protein
MSVGRPSKYDPAFVEQARKLCELGATDADLADFFGVHRATLYRWKHDSPEFCDALKAGKEASDDRVERSLYHKAVGYTFESEEIRVLRDGTVVRVPTKEHVPPDTTAAIFWLKNRRPEQWRDKHDVEHSGEVTQRHQHVRDEIARELDKHAAQGKEGGVARVTH